MYATTTDSLENVTAAEWNPLIGSGNPFVRHEFLVALERHGCVGEESGWAAQHVLIYDDDERLVGAAPMYLKFHSYGEYIFDWAWADAYARHGLKYFPKLVVAVPFSPVTGPRLLSNGAHQKEIRAGLIEATVEVAKRAGVSTAHWLFNDHTEIADYESQQLLRRVGCQFHWENPGFRDFEDFLDSLVSKKRKQIKRERRQARDAGVDIQMLPANQLDDDQWRAFHQFYCNTYDKKWGLPYLNLGFFREIGATLPQAVHLVMAKQDGRYIAGALCLGDDQALYGRNWGCDNHIPALHFEMCYYQTIEHCITHGLSRFEAGAQGDYKMSRGLMPTVTSSAHWVGHPQFREAIAQFLEQEREGIMSYIDYMNAHSPYRQQPLETQSSNDSAG